MSGSPVRIGIDEWLDPDTDLLELDTRVHDEEARQDTVRIELVGGGPVLRRLALGQLALRYQRLAPSRNDASRSASFEVLLTRHRALHALEKPLVRADYDHAIDTWQWVLQLAPQASLELQIAALFHDVERLESEADRRVEHLAPDYVAFKRRHAHRGATLTRSIIGRLISEQSSRRVGDLVEGHESPDRNDELQLLNDADALSFFGLNLVGYLRYYGRVQTDAKIAYTRRRMSAEALSWLPRLKLPAAATLPANRAITPPLENVR